MRRTHSNSVRASTSVLAAFRPSWSTISDHSLHIDLISSSRVLIFLWKVDSSSLAGEAGGVGFAPPLLPVTAPRLLEGFFFPEVGDSGDNGVEGPLKEANLPLITRTVSGRDQAFPSWCTRTSFSKEARSQKLRGCPLVCSGRGYCNILKFNG